MARGRRHIDSGSERRKRSLSGKNNGKHDVPVMIRVNKAQHVAFAGSAKRMGLSLSAWVRMILLQEVTKPSARR